MTKVNLDGMSHVEMVGLIEEIVKRIKTESFSEGYEAGRSDISDLLRERTKETPLQTKERLQREFREQRQAKRDRIVEQAKADVEELRWVNSISEDNLYRVRTHSGTFICYAEFIENKEKRTIVVLLRGYNSKKVRAKGIAKCAPGDCFNSHIGRAIALRRALGLEVPVEYLNAPAPTEVRVGDKIRLILRRSDLNGNIETVSGFYRENKPLTLESPGHIYEEQYKIIDDSREVSK